MALEGGDPDRLIENILNYRKPASSSTAFIDKYDMSYIIHSIEEKDQIRVIELAFLKFEPKGVDLIDFVRVLLNIIGHEKDETLYLTIGLVDLFKDICETYGLQQNFLKAKDILNYVVEVKIPSSSLLMFIFRTF